MWPLSSVQHISNELQYTLTGHFIKYTLLLPGWSTFAFKTALIVCGRDSTPYWFDDIMELMQICRPHSRDVNLLFHRIAKMLYWIDLVIVEAIWVQLTHCQLDMISA